VATKKTHLLPSNKESWCFPNRVDPPNYHSPLGTAGGKEVTVGKKVAVPGRMLSREGGGTAIVKEIVGRK
jgi:hypothetical protein